MSEYETKYDGYKYVKFPEASESKDYVEMTVRLPKPTPGKEWYYIESQYVFGLRPIRKLLDWSKVSGNVLVVTTGGDIQPMRYPTNHRLRGFYEGWQAHLAKESPVDVDACVVEYVKDGIIFPATAAKDAPWKGLTAFRVVGLMPGFEYH